MIATPHTSCRVCGSMLPAPFLDLGMQPLANNLCRLDGSGFDVGAGEHFDERYPLRLCRCAKCGLVQLDTLIDPAALFSSYLYVTGTNKPLVEHFRALAAQWNTGAKDGLVVDIGGNDGTLLSFFKERGAHVLNVEPAQNVARISRDKGIDTVPEFFNEDLAKAITLERGPATLITACNVFAHTPDWHAFCRAAKILLAPDGLLAIEFPYLPVMLQDGTFDLAYFEHASYPAITPLTFLFAEHGLDIIDVEEIAVHGGSVRVWVEHTQGRMASRRTFDLIATEKTSASEEVCRRFADHAVETRREFKSLVRDLVKNNKKVVGYTCPAKATTLIEFCGLTTAYIAYVVDDNPLKAGRLLPGSHIPVVASERLAADPPDAVILFAWNMADALVPKIRALVPPECKIIVPMPTPRIV